MNKGIIYYTNNRLGEPIFSVVQKYILNSGLPIVSVSLQPIDFGKNIVLKLTPGYLTMIKQILTDINSSAMINNDNFVDIEKAIKDLRALKIPRHRRRRIWKPFMEKYNCQIICEIGVQEAKNLMLMIAHNPKVAIAIDPWIDDGIVSRNSSGYSQEALDKQYENLTALAKEKTFIQVIRKYSFDAVNNFPDNYFDLIYIDADHTYDAVLKDIEDWYPKVKKGRFLVGDDYRNIKKVKTGVRFGVIKAVNKFAETNGLIVYELPGYNWAIIKI